MSSIGRRGFLKGVVGGASSLGLGSLTGCGDPPTPPPSDGWNAGDLAHLLPTANHERIRLKASFHRPVAGGPPLLSVGARRVAGTQSDSAGRFFRFDLGGLEPSTRHALRLWSSAGDALCDGWPLSTFPHPDARPEKLRLLVYTCAGGPDNLYNFGFFDAYLPIAHRQRLLDRALSFEPDAVVANGDHVYWDFRGKFGWAMGSSWRARWVAGLFDREAPVIGSANEDVLHRAFGPQIAGLYGVRFRSVPVFFLQDDHDYGENDEATPELRTFPPDSFMLDLARSTQHLYYPELLPDRHLPPAYLTPESVSESFGTLRYGRLLEAMLYDCRRYLSNARDPDLLHRNSRFVPADIESWLVRRTASSPCAHIAHMPSTPLLWSAGKWGEWYPDTKDEDGTLGVAVKKAYWPRGWGEQHDRLVNAAVARSDRTPLFVSGDLHATGVGLIHANRGKSLAANPPVSLLSGAVGTGWPGWPSQFRSQAPTPSAVLEAEELIKPLEENGFTLLDISEQEVQASFFRWTPDQGENALDRLEPFEVLRLPRPGLG